LERYLPTLTAETERLKALVLDILEITELDSGADLRREPVDLNQIMRDVVADFPATTQAPALRVQFSANSLPPVHGDEERLVQALRELVENGVIFTPAEGTVTLAAAAQEKDGRTWTTLTVRDTGPGLTPAEKERALDRFYRGDKAATGHVPGSGLGLSIVAEIAHLHGGHITVGNAPGGGAAFTLWLPAAA
jgi:two-component system sensor histidine kinase SenX3